MTVIFNVKYSILINVKKGLDRVSKFFIDNSSSELVSIVLVRPIYNRSNIYDRRFGIILLKSVSKIGE